MKLYILIIYILLVAPYSLTQYTDWVLYTGESQVTSTLIEGNFLWIGTYSGIVKLNIETGEKIFYNKTNTPLKSNAILSMAMDSSGNKWFGTWKGLAKFDGTEWTIYGTWNSNVPSNSFSCLRFEDSILWVGMGHYLLRFDGINWIKYDYTNSGLLPNSGIFKEILIDQWGVKWIASSRGLIKFDNTTWTYYYASNSIYHLAFDKNGLIWFSIGSKFIKYDGATFTQYDHTNTAMPYGIKRYIAFDSNNVLWYSNGWELGKFDGTNYTGYFTFNSPPILFIESINIDENNTKWIDTMNEGLVKFNEDETWEFIKNANSGLPSNLVNSVTIDNNNNKWFGTTRGVGFFDDQIWKVFNTTNSPLLTDTINCTKASDDGSIWIGTDKGLAVVKNNNWSIYTTANSGLFNDVIKDIEADKQGNVWIGTKQGGLVKINNNNIWTVYGSVPGNFYSIAIDSSNNKWMGTSSGIAVFNDTSWTYYNTDNSSLPGNLVNSITVDKFNKIWATIDGQGIVTFDGNNWTRFIPGNYLGLNLVTVASDRNGDIWFGSDQYGAAKYDGFTYTPYNTDNSGIAANYIANFDFDSYGNTWIAGGGVSVFREGGVIPVELTSFTASVIMNKVHLTWITESESNNHGFEVERSSDGEMWERINFIPGKGTTTVREIYTYTDELDLAGIFYYRLKQLDYDGSFRYSETIKVKGDFHYRFMLSQNYPNPFNPSTVIKYSIAEAGLVTIKVYDILGSEVATIVNEIKSPGEYSAPFNGSHLPSGIYFYSLSSGAFTQTNKFVLLK